MNVSSERHLLERSITSYWPPVILIPSLMRHLGTYCPRLQAGRLLGWGHGGTLQEMPIHLCLLPPDPQGTSADLAPSHLGPAPGPGSPKAGPLLLSSFPFMASCLCGKHLSPPAICCLSQNLLPRDVHHPWVEEKKTERFRVSSYKELHFWV